MSALLIVLYSLCGVYMLCNLRHDIHMLQQNSYRIDRYMRWLRSSGDMTSAWKLCDLAVIFMFFAQNLIPLQAAALIAGIYAVVKTVLIFRRKFKKALVFTRRVWRIYSVAGVISLAVALTAILTLSFKSEVMGFYSGISVAFSTIFLLSFLSWIIVIAAVVILTPVENAINRKFRNEAVSILRSVPGITVIGVTGSYGKTSTKHYLQRILSEKYEVLMTPGSYNTPMGVIRTIREMMKPYHEIFICEMGAKQTGDVKEICDMVAPQLGIVTAVGPMHLESFKSIENVQKTKFELIDSLPADGLAVVNNDFEMCAARRVNNVECKRYGVSTSDNCDYTAENVTYSPSGTTFTVKGSDGFSLDLKTRLVGECNISNLLGAVVIALRMNVSPEQIKRAVADIEQVEHRLNIKRTPGDVTIIDDAFNSNPSGSKMAVDVLSGFKSGRRIIVTPGMIELGERQAELNKEFGKHIAKGTDIAVIVGQYNREAICSGIKESRFDGDLHEVESFAEAQQLLAGILKPGDTVLYENDLPDTFK